MPFPILLLALPIIELTGLIYVGQDYGAMNVVLWVIFSIFIGIQVIRMAGWVTAQKLQDSMRQGDVPFAAMFQAAGMVFAGAFLIIPGFLTDIVGLLLLIGPVRNLIGRSIASRTTFHTAGMGGMAGMHGMGGSQHGPHGPHAPQDDTIIDGEFTVVDDEDTASQADKTVKILEGNQPNSAENEPKSDENEPKPS